MAAATGGARGAVVRSLHSSGLDVRVDGTQWSVEPRVRWDDDGLADSDLEHIDVPGASPAHHLRITFSLGEDALVRAKLQPTGTPNRYYAETDVLAVPAVPGKRLSTALVATATERADGGPMRGGPVSSILVSGSFEVPEEVHAMGVPGTGLLTSDAGHIFLHLAEVDGVKKYVAAEITFRYGL